VVSSQNVYMLKEEHLKNNKKQRLMVNDMASLYLNDILKRNGIDPISTKLIRHSLNHKRCKMRIACL